MRGSIKCAWLLIIFGFQSGACDNDAGDSGFSKETGNGSSTVTSDTTDDTTTSSTDVTQILDMTDDTVTDVEVIMDTASNSDVTADMTPADTMGDDTAAPEDAGLTSDTGGGSVDSQDNDLVVPVDTSTTNDAEPVDSGQGTDTTAIVGGGLEYGECLDLCKFDLHFTQTTAHLDVFSNAGEKQYSSSGDLTTTGILQLQEAANGLLGAEILDVYDCPGCNDSGKRYLILLLDNISKTTTYQEDKIPPVLKDADKLVRIITEALKTCKSSVQITVPPNCVPLP